MMTDAPATLLRLAAKRRYRTEFTVPAAWVQKRVLLHFGAVDWEATVYLNGKQLGVHKGGYSKFSYDITDNIRSHSGGTQELAVSVFDPTEWADGVPLGKQRYDVPGNRVRSPCCFSRLPTCTLWYSLPVSCLPTSLSELQSEGAQHVTAAAGWSSISNPSPGDSTANANMCTEHPVHSLVRHLAHSLAGASARQARDARGPGA